MNEEKWNVQIGIPSSDTSGCWFKTSVTCDDELATTWILTDVAIIIFVNQTVENDIDGLDREQVISNKQTRQEPTLKAVMISRIESYIRFIVLSWKTYS